MYVPYLPYIIGYDVIMAKVLNCDLKESEFELSSHYYVHFRANTIYLSD